MQIPMTRPIYHCPFAFSDSSKCSFPYLQTRPLHTSNTLPKNPDQRIKKNANQRGSSSGFSICTKRGLLGWRGIWKKSMNGGLVVSGEGSSG
ncbi:unnamed protein product [Lactuca virosa]|uniref:Uncharacterized protein n=1 Tax=Lactuca virosa TaxID=75947 RepID=A0AAU9NVY6_9ASTR|nr:unnamed protein product [Lactuca virosa]